MPIRLSIHLVQYGNQTCMLLRASFVQILRLESMQDDAKLCKTTVGRLRASTSPCHCGLGPNRRVALCKLLRAEPALGCIVDYQKQTGRSPEHSRLLHIQSLPGRLPTTIFESFLEHVTPAKLCTGFMQTDFCKTIHPLVKHMIIQDSSGPAVLNSPPKSRYLHSYGYFTSDKVPWRMP